tara:strand:+ start:228 stop:479 length:252 start_codon:yes stop_codon:yes gene_type:complete
MTVKFNSIFFMYKGYEILVASNECTTDRPNFRQVGIVWDKDTFEHLDEFDDNADTLIDALDNARELIDYHIDLNETLPIKKYL